MREWWWRGLLRHQRHWSKDAALEGGFRELAGGCTRGRPSAARAVGGVAVAILLTGGLWMAPWPCSLFTERVGTAGVVRSRGNKPGRREDPHPQQLQGHKNGTVKNGHSLTAPSERAREGRGRHLHVERACGGRWTGENGKPRTAWRRRPLWQEGGVVRRGPKPTRGTLPGLPGRRDCGPGRPGLPW